MKTITTGFLLIMGTLLGALQANAQHIKGNGDIQTQNRSISDFNAIDCAGSFDVFLTQGVPTSLKVVTDANLLPYIITEVKGNTLKLRMKHDVSVNPSKHIVIYITTKDLQAFSVSGVCNLKSENTLRLNDLKLAVSGVANMDLQLQVNTLKADISGTGKLTLKGKASDIDFQITGTGKIISDDLIADNGNVRISGLGKMHIQVQKQLKASVSGMGQIWYKGNPVINESVSGMGKIRHE